MGVLGLLCFGKNGPYGAVQSDSGGLGGQKSDAQRPKTIFFLFFSCKSYSLVLYSKKYSRLNSG